MRTEYDPIHSPCFYILMALLVAVACLPCGDPALAEEHASDTEVHVQRPVIVMRTHGDSPGLTWTMEGRRAFLGVQTLDLTPELREHFGVPRQSGVLISRIVEESPAAASDLAIGDIISAVDGEDISSPSELARSIGQHETEDTVVLDIWRQGSLRQIQATLVERQRPTVDIRQFRFPEAHLEALELSQAQLEGAIELKTETLNMAIEKLNQELESAEWHERVHTFKQHQGDLIERIEVLERRLKEMERELQELPEGE